MRAEPAFHIELRLLLGHLDSITADTNVCLADSLRHQPT